MCKRRKKPTEMQERGWQGYALFRIGMALSHLLLRVRYIGQENLPKDTPYLAVANHQSMFDGLWIMDGIPSDQLPRFSCLAGSDLEQTYGLTGRIMFRVGKAIPIDRQGNPLRGLLLAKKTLEKGNIVLIHPEGTRTHDGRLGDMMNGAAYLANKTNSSVIPVYIDGAYEVFSRHMSLPHPIDWKRLRRKTITIEYCPAIEPKDFANRDDLMRAINKVLYTKETQAFAKRQKETPLKKRDK
ncbi:MAG TPA: lysophospholipid acyltransferase family protein [Clostridia bacterium]|nr:lysophospholipid acyltransferase family protein [Clostridia bacterium]